jgi:hypothetical protein
MAGRVLQTDWKRIGRSGPTVDGRNIDPKMIDEMAASYNKDLYTALIWPEHQRYVNYGTVEALRSEDNDEGGKDLFSIISPNEFYTGSNHYGQKLFTSMEITPDFRKTGKAYLTGLGATDDPASAATSEIRLSKVADQGGIILTKSVESIDRTFEDPAPNGLLEQIKELFTKHQREDADMADKAALEKLSKEVTELKTLLLNKLTPAETDKDTADKSDDTFSKLSQDIASLIELFTKKPDQSDENGNKKATQEEQFASLNQKVETLMQQFSALQKNDHEDKQTSITPEQFKQVSDQLEAFGKKLADALQEQPGTNSGQHFGAEGSEDSKHIV